MNTDESSPGDSCGPADDERSRLTDRRAPERAGTDVSTVLNVAAAMIISIYMTSHSILVTLVGAVIILIVALALG